MAAIAYSEKIYGRLLAKTLPSVITNDKEYARMEADFNKLMDKGSLTLEENRLFDLLSTLLENYELQKLPKIKELSPADTLRFLMDENGLKQKDLEDVFGSQAVVSKVLSGKRSITKLQAKKLGERFRMSTDAFI